MAERHSTCKISCARNLEKFSPHPFLVTELNLACWALYYLQHKLKIKKNIYKRLLHHL